MKKQYVILLLIFLSSSIFYTSCNSKMKNTGSFEFDSIKIDEKVHMFGDTAKPACNLILDFTYITKSSDKPLKDSLNNLFVAAFFGEEYVGESIDQIVDLYKETYITEYREDLEPMYLEDLKNRENREMIQSWYSYYRKLDSSIDFYEKDLLVYRVDLYEYTGGAHGIYHSGFMNINLQTMTPLAMDDIFVGDYTEPLTELLWQQLMQDNDVSSREELEDMGFGLTGDLMPVNEFILSKDGITFYYNVYEFAPYVMGPVEIKLPYSKISHMLSDEKIISQIRD